MNVETTTFPQRAVIVWVLLVALTISTFWLGTHQPFGSTDTRVGSALVIALAFAKVYFIVADFMEVRHAPRALKIAFGIWFTAIGGAIVVLNLV
ncbi:hypothetical protein CH294_04870 [Rhodococcus sp. 14-2483-1-1]|uniref:cytochrome C oxidase subunit IV family protein n=1 Tax=Rhodococcus sp. 14-2483-1-1 TaxID=2023148 RepID=UPI000B9C22B9|nr:cytochrome C oxidase subunit IV family protein [Rhodococcus sp. 14-2483-1-1]OZF40622.1 hypothetical protein CH294_04870 [Rhodococcus sp. 14-2483-1-1]